MEKKFKPKIIQFPKADYEYELDELRNRIKRGEVRDLLLAYTVRIPDAESSPNRFVTYWFGESTCLYLLGLTVRLQEKISDFMDKNLEL